MAQKVNKKRQQWFSYLHSKHNKKRGKGVSNVVINVLVLRTSLASLVNSIGIIRLVLRKITYCGSLFWIQLTVSR